MSKTMETAQVMVSVILPVYNTKIYLEDSIGSVIDQTFEDFELICVNDGFSDGSLEVLREWEKRDQRIRVFSQDNKGLSSARNLGFMHAKGKYVYFLDSDDLLSIKALETLVKKCEELELDLICFSSEAFNDMGSRAEYIRGGSYPGVLKGTELMFLMNTQNEWYPPVWMQFYRREYLADRGVRFIDGVLHEDWSWSFEAFFYAKRSLCINDVLHYRRKRQGSTQSAISFKNVTGIFENCIKIRESISSKKETLTEREKEACESVFSLCLSKTWHYYLRIPYNERMIVGENVTHSEEFEELVIEPMGQKEHIISIVAIFHDQEMFVERCMESLVHQSYQNIEIICVDDASSDNTFSILKRYEDSYAMVRLLRLEKNSSQNVARKRGAEAAAGGYLLFVDGDDKLESNCCEVLIEKASEKPVDILHFDCNIIFDSKYTERDIHDILKCFRTFEGELHGPDIFFSCFVNQGYTFKIWSNLYKTSVVKEAFSELEESFIPAGQDFYQYLLIAAKAETFRGISEKLYDYYYGNGVTTSKELDPSVFEKCCSASRAVEAARRFAAGKNDRLLEEAVSCAAKTVFDNCAYRCINSEGFGLRRGLGILASSFGASYVAGRLADLFWDDWKSIYEELKDTDLLTCRNKEIKTIAVYYFKVRMGGAQRVMAELARIWKQMGYRLILITDEEIHEDDYVSAEEFERVMLPPTDKIERDTYERRADALRGALKKYAVDLVVYHSWEGRLLLWDLLLCKMNGTKFAVHCHNIFSEPVIRNTKVFLNSLYAFSLADGIITLSDTDERYWSMFNDRVFTVQNPMFFRSVDELPQSPLSGKTIIWCQRISWEKRPLDMIEIFEMVHETDRSTRLLILGNGDDPRIKTKLLEWIYDHGLNDAVTFLGYRKDVEAYYGISDVCMLTSEYEGFPLGVVESLGAGVPVVMYEMPYLTIAEKGKGIVSVRKYNKEKMAEEIVRILNDRELRMRLGQEGRDMVSDLLAYDYEGVWRNIFERLENEEYSIKQIPLMWNTLMEHLRLAFYDNTNKEGLFKFAIRVSDLERRAGNHEEALIDHESILNHHDKEIMRIWSKAEEQNGQLRHLNETVNHHGDVLNHSEKLLNHHEKVVNRHEEVLNRHEEMLNRHEEVTNRHEEVVNRHEEVVNRHEEVVNRHESSINHQWEVQKWHEHRIQALEPRKYYCPCCDNRIYKFKDGEFRFHTRTSSIRRYIDMPQDVICPECGSLPRHRILAAWMESNIELIKGKKILHFALDAMEEGLRRWYHRHEITVQTADLLKTADLNIDIQDTGLMASSRDVIICNHVLEHVEDYKKALDELRRILTDDGICILSFPIDNKYSTVYEDPSKQTEEERIIAFGQKDHLRIFGRDSKELLQQHGFQVEEIRGKDMPREIRPVTGPADYDINVLFLCRKA